MINSLFTLLMPDEDGIAIAELTTQKGIAFTKHL